MIPEWNIEAMRSKLIADDLDDLSPDEIGDIVDLFWQEFKPLAVRYLESRWNDGGEVYQEAVERGYTKWEEPELW